MIMCIKIRAIVICRSRVSKVILKKKQKTKTYFYVILTLKELILLPERLRFCRQTLGSRLCPEEREFKTFDYSLFCQ